MSDLEATAREALEVAEEELAFVKDTGSDKMVVSRRATYKRQRVLARGVLELLEERDRLWKCVERNERLWRSEAEYYPDARELRQTRLDRAEMCREALAPKGEGEG